MRLFLYFCQTIRFEKYDFTKKLFDVLEEKILEEKIYGIFNTDESLSSSTCSSFAYYERETLKRQAPQKAPCSGSQVVR